MSTLPEMLFVARTAPESNGAYDFLITETSVLQWDIVRPRIGTVGTEIGDILLATNIEVGALSAGLAEVQDDAEATALVGENYLWVSYAGLRSVLQYKPQETLQATAAIGELLGSSACHASPSVLSDNRWSVLIIKPDAHDQGMDDLVTDMVISRGLNITASTGPHTLTPADVERIWTPPYKWNNPQPAGPWWHATVEYMCEGQSSAHLVAGDGASVQLAEIKQELRALSGHDPHAQDDRPIEAKVRSLIHTSDGTEELVRNASLFWRPAILRALIANNIPEAHHV